MFTWITKLGFAGVLSCLAFLLSLFTTGVASAHSTSTGTKLDSIWSVNVDSVAYSTDTSYNGYDLLDPNNTHFEIVRASYTNTTSIQQTLSKPLFKLQAGIAYTEDQASHPDETFDVDPGSTQQTTTVFVIPDTLCYFTLNSLIDDVQTSYHTTYPGC